MYIQMEKIMYSLQKNKYGFMQIKPSPSYEEVDKFYREDFYSEEYKYFNDSSLAVQNADLDYNQKLWKVDHIELDKLYDGTIETILDIGCGWCKYLEWCKSEGYEVTGLDPSPESSDYGKLMGIDVKTSNFEQLTNLDKRFDLVVLKNVLEHVIEPDSFLLQISNNYMQSGSLLQIEVPNEFNPLQMAAQRLHNLDEWWVAPPAHLNYFTKDSLQSLCEATGFELVNVKNSFPMEMFLLMGKQYVGNQELGSECHKLRKTFEQNLINLGQIDLLQELYKKLAELNIGRQITMVVRKMKV